MVEQNLWLSIAPLEWTGLLSGLLCGAIVGIERQLCGKPVGMRTSALICIGAYIFVALANTVADTGTDNSRIIGQLVTGVGFLGAGVMMARDGMVVGVTSAAAIWLLAAIGAVLGSGYYLSGIKLALLTVSVLVGVNLLEGTFKSFQRGVHQKYTEVTKQRQRRADDT